MTRTMIGLRLPPALLKAFDKWWKRAGYHNRTHAVENIMKAKTIAAVDHGSEVLRYRGAEEKSK